MSILDTTWALFAIADLREHTYIADKKFVLPCGQVNNPDPAAGAHIRTVEWKHMMPPAEAAA